MSRRLCFWRRLPVRVGEKYHDQPELEAAVRLVLGHSFDNLGYPEKAITHLEIARKAFEGAPGYEMEFIQTLRLLAFARHTLSDFKTAEALWRQAYTLSSKHLGPLHEETLMASSGLANTLGLMRKSDEAKALFEETLKLQMKVEGEKSVRVVRTQINYITLNMNLGEKRFSDEEILRILSHSKEIYGENHARYIRDRNIYAMRLWHNGDYAGAEIEFRDIYEADRVLLGDHNPGNPARACQSDQYPCKTRLL